MALLQHIHGLREYIVLNAANMLRKNWRFLAPAQLSRSLFGDLKEKCRAVIELAASIRAVIEAVFKLLS